MGFQDILVDTEGRIRIVTLNRPEVLNALREKTLLEFESVLNDLHKETRIGTLIITGSGDRAFCAGGDVKALEKMTSREAESFARTAHRILGKMEGLPQPIIAAVNGYALGAGCDLVAACDLAVASEKAVFGEPPLGLGIVTPFGGTQRIPRLIGPRRSKHLFFTGETLDAQTALQFGLVNMVVKHEALMAEAKALAERILSRAPIPLKYCKHLINLTSVKGIKEGDEEEIQLYAKCFDTEDSKEGIKAFLEKRKPVFQGK